MCLCLAGELQGRSVSEFRINISNLSEGIHEYSFETEPFKIGLDECFNTTVKVAATLDKSLRQILLQAKVTTSGVFECDRCLEQFSKQLNVAYTIVYIQDNRTAIDVKKEEEVQVLSADTNYIDLDEDVRQYILLALPQKLLCVEDCLGLCPNCGINKNSSNCTCQNQTFDSRWDALKKLSSS